MEEYCMKCRDCGRDFIVRITTMGCPGCKEKEEIECPYCHSINGTRMTDGFVETFKK